MLLADNRRMALAAAFVSAALRYWLGVFPTARRVMHRLEHRAAKIPDPALRRLALDAQQSKWASLEGAAAFAAFVPRGQRAAVTRLLVLLQCIYDYTDTLMEQPNGNPAANARQLHMALLAALQPHGPQLDYYAHCARRNDGGYLIDLVEACRAAIARLPSYALISATVVEKARGIAFYQSAINLALECDHPTLIRWAALQLPPSTGLKWWETGAASGSSLVIFALLAAAADPTMTRQRATAIEAIYWPWGGALHTLLDSLVDRDEDAATGQHELLNHYTSPEEVAERLHLLALEAIQRAGAVGVEHSLILAGMTGLYLSDKRAWSPAARPATERVLAASGELAATAMLLLRVRRLIHRKAHLYRAGAPF
jgi:tetraprenyl-beta-curcumene synthase